MEKFKTKKGLIALFCIILVVMTTPVTATEVGEEFEERNTGEPIIINIKSYEPEVVVSSLLEENDIPVFAYLTGVSPGRILGIDEAAEPFFSDPPIRKVTIKPINFPEEYVRSVKHVDPLRYSIDNLGYLVVTLRRVEEEKKVPEIININMSGRVEFDAERGILGVGQQDLLLPEEKSETEWTKKADKAENQFFANRGYLRAYDIKGDRATIEVYDGSLKHIKKLPLRKGETSDYINLREADILMQNAFRLKLAQILNPQQKKAKVLIQRGKESFTTTAVEGMPLYSGSEWRVKLITELEEGSKVTQKLIVEGPTGEEAAERFKEYTDIFGKIADTKTAQEIEWRGRTLSDLANWLASKYNIGVVNLEGELAQYGLPNTNKPRDDATVGNILLNYLPKGVGFKISKDAELIFYKEDPCENVELLNLDLDVTEAELNEQLNKIAPKEDRKISVYCTAIDQLKNIISETASDMKDEKGNYYHDLAYYNIGSAYEELKASSLALQHYKSSQLHNRNIKDVIDKIASLETNIQDNAQKRPVSINDNGIPTTVTLLSVMQAALEKPYAIIETEGFGDKKYVEGDKLKSKVGEAALKEVVEGTEYTYEWVISRIESDKVTVEKNYIGQSPPKTKKRTEALNLEKSKMVEGDLYKLKRVELHQQAVVTVLPGTGKTLYSYSNFSIHIPIEKRAIKLNPDKIGEKINKTEEKIEKLDKIIKNLENIVKSWKSLCLATFAWLTLKNSFLTGLSKSQARKNVMRGENGWYTYCEQNSGKGRLHKTFDDCMGTNSEKIRRNVMDAQTAIGTVNKEFKGEDYKTATWYKNLVSDYEKFDKYGGFVEEEFFTVNELRDYRYWTLMKESDSYSSIAGGQVAEQPEGVEDYNFKGRVDKELESFRTKRENSISAYNNVVAAIEGNYKDFDSIDKEKQKQVFTDLYDQSMSQVLEKKEPLSRRYPLLDNYVTIVTNLNKEGNKLYANTLNGKVYLVGEATFQTYMDTLKKQDQTSAVAAEIQSLEKSEKENLNAPLSTGYGNVYRDENNNLYAAVTTAFATEQIRTTYAKHARVEFYPDGKPYCIPTSKGNFIKVLEFHKDGSAKTVELWNVGADGLLCSNDDVLIKHESLLTRDPYELQRYLTTINRINPQEEGTDGQILTIDSNPFVVSHGAAQEEKISKPNCYDVMDPNDCRRLFGVCDPVMCPPSRFNLGGRWAVPNVVATGLIGSIFLGLPNFDPVYEPVPVCLTGINAGLQNIRSILQGYVECLKTAKVQGKSVGICDAIRSVFTCEMIWKEAGALLNAKGGIINLISEKIYGEREGGGEYLTFKSSLDNVANSVKFFTQDYASTAFAAYQSRSMEEIGAEICKAYIHGKFPNMGEMFDQMAQPESPPQFTALLQEFKYSETQGLSRYQIVYHIYAGEDREVQYSVYLKDAIERRFYATERCEGKSGVIPKGGIASFSVDCIADTGMEQVCVMINGIENCGFGKVSSAFSINYLNDLIVQDESKRNIDTEEKCVPALPKTSPSLGSLPLPGSFGMTNTGIVRVCSIQNPGEGTNPADWKPIGTCGKDAQGRSLGNCWIDLRTVSINDAERMESVKEDLQKRGYNITKAQRYGIELMSDEDSNKEMQRIAEEFSGAERENCANWVNRVIGFVHLSIRTANPDISSAAQLKAAETLLEIARDENGCGTVTAGELEKPKEDAQKEVLPTEKDTAIAGLNDDKLYIKYGDKFLKEGETITLTKEQSATLTAYAKRGGIEAVWREEITKEEFGVTYEYLDLGKGKKFAKQILTLTAIGSKGGKVCISSFLWVRATEEKEIRGCINAEIKAKGEAATSPLEVTTEESTAESEGYKIFVRLGQKITDPLLKAEQEIFEDRAKSLNLVVYANKNNEDYYDDKSFKVLPMETNLEVGSTKLGIDKIIGKYVEFDIWISKAKNDKFCIKAEEKNKPSLQICFQLRVNENNKLADLRCESCGYGGIALCSKEDCKEISGLVEGGCYYSGLIEGAGGDCLNCKNAAACSDLKDKADCLCVQKAGKNCIFLEITQKCTEKGDCNAAGSITKEECTAIGENCVWIESSFADFINDPFNLQNKPKVGTCYKKAG